MFSGALSVSVVSWELQIRQFGHYFWAKTTEQQLQVIAVREEQLSAACNG